MNALLKRSATHVLCAGAGICAAVFLGAVTGPRGAQEPAAPLEQPEPPAAEMRETVKAKPPAIKGTRGWKSADYRSAWDAVSSRDLTARQRVELQSRLLEEWSMVDLEAAMKAALENPWEGGKNDGAVDSLTPLFREAFRKNPIEAWRIIQSGSLGLGGALFRWQWVDSVAEENPLLVISYFDGMSVGLQRAALNPILTKHAGNAEVEAAVRRMLAGLPAGEAAKDLAAEYFKFAPPKETPAELSARMNAETTETGRLISFQALIASLRMQDMATIRAEWGKLPTDAKNELTAALLTSPGLSWKNPTDLLDMAIQTGNWELFKDPRISGAEGLMAEYAKRAEAISLAEWGLSLPDRPETADVFRRSVSAYIGQNYMDARGWILSIPEGDWRRERALAEYSQNALWAKKDPAGSQWAIDQIQDPKMKGTVINWRKEWTERTGRK